MEPDFRPLEDSPLEDSILKIVKTHGHAVLKIDNGLTYTVGAPVGFDLAISGIQGEVAQTILNIAVDVLRDAQISLSSLNVNKPGQLCLVAKGVLGNNLPLYGVVVGIKPTNAFRKEPTLLVQLLYPDSVGFMPWEAGYSMACQKMLVGGEENSTVLRDFPSSRHLCVIGYGSSQVFGSEEIVLRDSDGTKLHLPSRQIHVLRVVS